MTNKEAIRILGLECDEWDVSHCTASERREAFEMAITALQELDKNLAKLDNSNDGVNNANSNSTNEIENRVNGMTACRVPEIAKDTNVLNNDTISRQAAIDALDEIRHALWEIDIPSPTVPEYVEHHEQVQSVWKLLDKKQKELYVLPPVQPEQDREFIKLTVRNSNGRPYYSIIYLELDDNGVGHDFEGYSSYSLDVISDYLKKYFMPSAQPERTCVNCGRTANNGGWYADGGTRCPIEEHYALPKDGYCHLWEKRNITDDDYPERRTDD